MGIGAKGCLRRKAAKDRSLLNSLGTAISYQMLLVAIHIPRPLFGAICFHQNILSVPLTGVAAALIQADKQAIALISDLQAHSFSTTHLLNFT